MCRLHLEHLDHLDTMIAKLDSKVEQMMRTFLPQRDLIVSIPGFGVRASAAIVSEIGADPAAWFPSAEQLASWAGLCPANHVRRQTTSRTATQGQPASAAGPGRVRVGRGAHRRLPARVYRRQVRKFGGFRSPAAKQKAIVAVAHKLIVILWHVLATGRPYEDLGADYFTTRIDPEKERRRLVAKLEAPGFKVTLEPAA